MRRINRITPLDNYLLLAEFDNGERRVKDISGLLNKPVFAPLKNPNVFKRATVLFGAVTWNDENGNEIDICPDAFYESSAPYGDEYPLRHDERNISYVDGGET